MSSTSGVNVSTIVAFRNSAESAPDGDGSAPAAGGRSALVDHAVGDELEEKHAGDSC
jgi:hypothetical protein